MSFVRRKIALKFELGGAAEFANPYGIAPSSSNTITITGSRAVVNITEGGGPGMGQAEVRVFGLTPSEMQRLSSLNQATQYVRNNKITILAGDDVNGMAVIFTGGINLSRMDMQAVPASSLYVMAWAGFLQAVQPASPSSYPATAKVGVIMQNLATAAGLNFENWGVDQTLATPYLPGALWEQIDRCAKACIPPISYTLDRETLAIWPQGGNRGGEIPLISPDTGLVGYPGYATAAGGGGIAVTCVFNPALRFGGQVQVQSELQLANGTWKVFNLSHQLESEVPGGKWFSHFESDFYGY